MENLTPPGETAFALKIGGKMTYEYFRELEDRIIDVMRHNRRLEIDLSEVVEIDLSGLHLLELLLNVGVLVATSPVVEQASRKLLLTGNSLGLGRVRRRERRTDGHPGPSLSARYSGRRRDDERPLATTRQAEKADKR
jgi:anti-anti-sigma regulatory factor